MEEFEEHRSQDIAIAEVIDSLNQIFPEISENQIGFIYHGTYNVFEVKSEYIFRFPDKLFRNPKGFDLINKEVKILNLIRPFVSLVVPNPIYISREPNNPFMGYKKINGISLSKCFNKTSNSDKTRIAESLSKFLSQLHSTKLVQKLSSNKVISKKFNFDEYRQEWQRFYEDLRKISFQLLNKRQKEWILKLEYGHYNIPRPDMSIFLDVPFQFTKKKLTTARAGEDRDYLLGNTDIHEQDLEFQKKVRQEYLEIVEEDPSVRIVDCSDGSGQILAPELVFSRIRGLLFP